MEYKTGDKFKVKSYEGLVGMVGVVKDSDGELEFDEGNAVFAVGMKDHCGMELIVRAVIGDTYRTEGNDWEWEEWMLEDIPKQRTATANVDGEVYLDVIQTDEPIVTTRAIYETIKNGSPVMAGYLTEALPHFDEMLFVGKSPIDGYGFIVSDFEGCTEAYDLILPLHKYEEMEKLVIENRKNIMKDYIRKFGLGEIE
jgi:hypothetical protein